MPVKVTVNLPEETVAKLKKMAADRGGALLTDVIVQAIETQAYLDEQMRGGKRLLLQSPDNNTVQRLQYATSAKAKMKS